MLLTTLSVTHARAATETRIIYVPIQPQPGIIEAEVSPRILTSIQALDDIADWELGDSFHYEVKRNENDSRRVTLQPRVAYPNTTNLKILSGGHWYSFEVKLARDDIKPVSSVIFVPTKEDIPALDGAEVERSCNSLSEDELNNAVSEALSVQSAEHDEEIETMEEEASRAQAVSEEAALLTQLQDHHATKLRNGRSCNGTDLAICKQRWTLLKGYGMLRFVVRNRSRIRQEVRNVAVHDEFGARNHASLVSIDGQKPTPSREANIKLAPGQSVVMSVSVRDPQQMGKSIKVALGVVGRALPAFKTIDLDPEPEEGEGLITLSLQGIAGAVWLDNPVESDQLGAASTTGLAMRVRYGFNKRWSFEGELGGVRSGNVNWNGMTFESQEGAIERNATLGRILVGGLLHFGDKYRPLIRAGLGFRAVSHSSRFRPLNGGEQSGPGGGFAADGLYYVGLGFEAKVSQRWTAGISATTVGIANRFSGEGLSGSVEAGLHLSYGWTPGY